MRHLWLGVVCTAFAVGCHANHNPPPAAGRGETKETSQGGDKVPVAKKVAAEKPDFKPPPRP